MSWLVALAIAIALGLPGLASAAAPASTLAAASASPAALLPIVIGYQPDSDWLTLEARKLHLFEKAGLKPSFLHFVAGAPMMAAAESKSIDIAEPGFVPFLSGVEQGVPWAVIGIIGVGPRGQVFVARKGSGIHDFAELRGKRIGYYRSSGAQYALFTAFKRAHIPLSAVTLLSLAPAAQVAAMRSGQIDAAVVWEPWPHLMVAKAHGRVFATADDLHILAGTAVYAARRDWLAAHPETAKRFETALILAGQAMLKNPQPALDAFAAEVGISHAWATDMLHEVPAPEPWRWLDPSYKGSLVKGADVAHALRNIAAFMYQQHILTKKIPDAGALIDRAPITAALKNDADLSRARENATK